MDYFAKKLRSGQTGNTPNWRILIQENVGINSQLVLSNIKFGTYVVFISISFPLISI